MKNANFKKNIGLKGKKGTIFYFDKLKTFKGIHKNNPAQAADIMMALWTYDYDSVNSEGQAQRPHIEKDYIADALIQDIMDKMDYDNQKYIWKCEVNRSNAKKCERQRTLPLAADTDTYTYTDTHTNNNLHKNRFKNFDEREYTEETYESLFNK